MRPFGEGYCRWSTAIRHWERKGGFRDNHDDEIPLSAAHTLRYGTADWSRVSAAGGRVWTIRVRLQPKRNRRDLMTLHLAVDGSLRGCDLVRPRINDLSADRCVRDRSTLLQKRKDMSVCAVQDHRANPRRCRQMAARPRYRPWPISVPQSLSGAATSIDITVRAHCPSLVGAGQSGYFIVRHARDALHECGGQKTDSASQYTVSSPRLPKRMSSLILPVIILFPIIIPAASSYPADSM